MARPVKLPPNVAKLIKAIKTDEKAMAVSERRGWSGVKATDMPDEILRRSYDKIEKINKLYKTKQITGPQYKAAMRELEVSIPRIQEKLSRNAVEFPDVPKELRWNPDTLDGPQRGYFDPAKAGKRPVRNISLNADFDYSGMLPQSRQDKQAMKMAGPTKNRFVDGKLIETEWPKDTRPGRRHELLKGVREGFGGPKLAGMTGTAGTGDPINLKKSLLADNYTGGPSPDKFGPRGGKTLGELGRVSPLGQGSAIQTMLGDPTRVDPIVNAESRLKPHHPTGALLNSGANAEPAGASVRRHAGYVYDPKERRYVMPKTRAPEPEGMGPWKQAGRGSIPAGAPDGALPGVKDSADVKGTHMMRLRKGLENFDLAKAGKIGGKVAKGGLLGLPLLALDYLAPGNAIASSRKEGYGMLDDMGLDIQGGIDSIENPWARGGASLLDGLLVDPAMTAIGGAKSLGKMLMDDLAEAKRLKKKRKESGWKPKRYRGGARANGD